jgi:hypothetical protein
VWRGVRVHWPLLPSRGTHFRNNGTHLRNKGTHLRNKGHPMEGLRGDGKGALAADAHACERGMVFLVPRPVPGVCVCACVWSAVRTQ